MFSQRFLSLKDLELESFAHRLKDLLVLLLSYFFTVYLLHLICVVLNKLYPEIRGFRTKKKKKKTHHLLLLIQAVKSKKSSPCQSLRPIHQTFQLKLFIIGQQSLRYTHTHISNLCSYYLWICVKSKYNSEVSEKVE